MDKTQIEIDVLLEALYRSTGYDFRDYTRSSLKRRLLQHLQREHFDCIADMIPRLIHDDKFQQDLLKDLTIHVTDMFRDPEFFLALRRTIVPLLKTYPFVNIWHAGCASGEEVYSMAILLMEEGFYERVNIYATDSNPEVIQRAKDGIYPVKRIQQFTENYHKAGGRSNFSHYYHSKYQQAKMKDILKKNIVFANHNLVSDGVFSSMHMIICRNVMIYFNPELKNRVLSLFLRSMERRGFLCLGKKESLDFTEVREVFDVLLNDEKIYQKK